MATRNVDDVAAELYAVTPSSFVAVRTDAVRAARDAGDRDLAAAIGKLRRPTVAAWAVNLLTRDCGDGLAQLLAPGVELREAHQQLRGEALQLLSGGHGTARCRGATLGTPSGRGATQSARCSV